MIYCNKLKCLDPLGKFMNSNGSIFELVPNHWKVEKNKWYYISYSTHPNHMIECVPV